MQFETALAIFAREIVSRDVASQPRRDAERSPCGHVAVDRALCLFLRLRQEAAYWLGFQASRAGQWREEYYFALAVYGLLTAKWPVDATHLEWALISAGVAVVQLEHAEDPNGIVRQLSSSPAEGPAPAPLPTHLIPLGWGHCHWKAKDYAFADAVLRQAKEDFPHAVALCQEAALCWAAQGQLMAAESELKALRPLCRVFRDFETLCRLGRVLKESGDAAWEIDRPAFEQFVAGSHSGFQLYNDAKGFYGEAFEFSGDYYPGINAATLALLTGDARAADLADEVRRLCAKRSVADLEDRFWINATEGEAALVARRADAVGFYEAALGNPCAKSQGMLQPVYNQLCRLHWALGPEPIAPILATMEKLNLAPEQRGPFENCGRT